MTATGQFREIVVVPAASRSRGVIHVGGIQARCALGRAGRSAHKREGDGATPVGTFRLLGVLYRPDRLPRPRTRLPVTAITPQAGWCDDPADRAYNRPVELPYAGRHERLWRDDHLYDLVVVIDYNVSRPQKGAGSAIFLHLPRDGFAPTEGCVAVSLATMRRLLPRLGPQTLITIR
jgi:L,D-peptidoglycan transpeptidase YkuD (ErfK/YbiS/YcfS/YnhG family)